jgi:hypothetical protein
MSASTAGGESRGPALVGIAILAAVCAIPISIVTHSVRHWVAGTGSVIAIAALVWLALMVIGVGGAWVLHRIMGDPTAASHR